MVFVLPLALTAALWGYGRSCLPERAWWGVPVATLLYFILPGLGAYGVGLESLISAGLVPSFFALVLFTFFAWSIESLVKSPGVKGLIVAGIMLGAIFLSHTLTTVFSLLYLAVTAILGNRATRRSLVGVVLIALVVGSWWLIPFVKNLPYSSGEAIVDNNALSPLSIFFPIGPADSRMITTGALERELLNFEQPATRLLSAQSALGIFFLLTVTAGIAARLMRHEYRLPLVFLLGVALVPGGFILSTLGLPLHAYRFSACLWMVEILLCAEGLSALAGNLPSRRSAVVIGIGFLIGAFGCIRAWNHFGTLVRNKSLFVYRVEERPGFASAEGLLQFLSNNRPQGRIAVESDMRSLRIFGSPHWLLTEIPRRLNIPTVPGVYAESSLAAPFITPTLANLGNQLVWGAPELARRGSFMRQTRRSMIARLKLFSVEMIVATSGKMRRNLNRMKRFGVQSLYENSDLSLYSLGAPLPPLQTFSSKPFLVIDQGGLSFRSLTKLLYASPDLFDIPLIDGGARSDSLPRELQSQLSGVLVSCSRSSKLTEQDLKSWQELGPLILINCPKAALPQPAPEGLILVPYLFREYHVDMLSKVLRSHLAKAPPEWRAQAEMRDDEHITGSSIGPVLVRRNAARCWKEKQRFPGALFKSNPSFMAVMGTGNFELEYRC
jgi:hypothetical protein